MIQRLCLTCGSPFLTHPCKIRVGKGNYCGVECASVSHQKYTLDEHFFDRIDTEEKAWLLGFITGDGSIHRNCLAIGLAEKDEEILHRIKLLLKSDHPLNRVMASTRTNLKTGEVIASGRAIRLAIVNRHLSAALKSVGIVEKKTFLVKPWQGPENLQRHYYRGLVDADGSIFRSVSKRGYVQWVVTCVGNRFMMDGYAAFLSRHIGKTPKIRSTKSIYQVPVSGIVWAKNTARLLYEGASIGLERKCLLAAEVLAWKSTRRLLTYNGKTQDMASWAKELNITHYILYKRLNELGWSVEDTLATPHMRPNRPLTFQGKTHTVAEWAEITGIRKDRIWNRVYRGWPVEQILATTSE